MNDLKVEYFEGRPHGHPTHSLYAKSVKANFNYFDKYIRYHDSIKPNKFKTYLSWFVTSIFFPKKKVDIFLTEEPYYAIALMKILKLINRNQKIVSILGTHTTYFLKIKRYTPTTQKLLLYLFSKYDIIICEGEMQKNILDDLLINYKSKPKIYKIENGATQKRLSILSKIKPNLLSNRILTIAGIPNQDRLYYKGMDLNIRTFDLLMNAGGDFYYDIIGEISKDLQNQLLENYSEFVTSRITFLGRVNDFENKISNYSLCLHLARGEAWGISINETLAAGIPTLVSEWTGSKELVEKISINLISSLNPIEAVEKIKSYYNLDIKKKKNMSDKCKKISLEYTEDKSVKLFQTIFYESIK